MSAGKVCEVCFSPDLVQEAGLLICAVCGTQSQQFIDEGYGEEEAPVGVRVVKTPTAKTKSQSKTGEKATPEVVKRNYCLTLQHTLFALCEHLHKMYGLDEAIFSTARRIWFAALNHHGILEPNAMDDVNKTFPRYRRSFVREEEEEEVPNDPSAFDEQLTGLKYALLKLLSPFRVLSVLFLAAFILRSELSLFDIVCLSTSGELPFHRELVVAGTRMDPDGSCRIVSLLNRLGLDPPGTLLNDVLRLAESIQLKLPPVNAEAVLCKYCHTLQLPKDVHAGAVALLDVYQAAGYHPRLNFQPQQDPYLQLMALLVFVIRAKLQDKSNSEWADFDWLTWSRKILRSVSARHPPGFQLDGVSFPDNQSMMALARRFRPSADVPEKVLLLQESLWKAARAPDPILRNENPIEVSGEAGDMPNLDEAEQLSCLLVAAGAVCGVFPAVMRQYLIPVEQELLKIERTTAVLGLAESFPKMLATLDVQGMIKAPVLRRVKASASAEPGDGLPKKSTKSKEKEADQPAEQSNAQ